MRVRGPQILCVVLVATASAARAQQADIPFPVSPQCVAAPESETAARAIAAYWFEQGTAQVDREAFAEAVLSFGCSYVIVPHTDTLYNLARAADWAGESAMALRAFREFLELAPDPENREEIDAIILRLVAATEAETGAPLPPYEGPGAGPSGPGSGGPVVEGADSREVAAWMSISLGAAGAVVGSVFAGLAAVERSKIEDAEEGTAWTSVASRADRVWNYDVATILGFSVAGAATLAGVLLLTLGGDEDTDAGPAVTVAPSFDDGGVGLAVMGRF